jgi:ABC-2 type transport system permease protein
MTAATATAMLPSTAVTGRASFGGALRSEFTKILSVRSTYWTLLGMLVVTVGFGALASYGISHGPGGVGPQFDPTRQSLFGLYFSQLIIGALGVLVISSEFSTGMIRTTLSTMPRRGTVVAAKGVVFSVVAFVAGLVTCLASFFVGQALMGHDGTSLAHPDVVRAVIGGALYLTACGLLAFGLGLIIRHTAGAISAVVALLFVVILLTQALPQSWQDHVDKWMPALAGGQIWATHAQLGSTPVFSPWTGFAVLCMYAAIAVAAGALLFRKRDA